MSRCAGCGLVWGNRDSLGAWIAERRRHGHIIILQLASNIGITEDRMRQIENNKILPSDDEWRKICNVLCLSRSERLYGESLFCSEIDPCPADPGFWIFETWFCSEECAGEVVPIDRRRLRSGCPDLYLSPKWGTWGEEVHLRNPLADVSGREIEQGSGRL